MNQAFQEDLIALSLILNQEHTVSVGYSLAEIADAETASGICFPIALKTVYETVGKDSILAKGFYAPCEIRILHEPRTYCFKPFGEYIGFEFADTDGKRYAYFPFRRRDRDYKCYEKLEQVFDKPHEYFANISDNRRKAPDYSGFLDLFADRIMDRMKYIITFTGKKAMNDYIAVCQGFGAEDFQTYLPHLFRGEETRHIMHCSKKGLLIIYDDSIVPKLQIGTDSALAVEEISRIVKTKLIRDNGKKVIDPKYYFNERLPESLCERLELIYSLYYGKAPSKAELPSASLSALPESLSLFYQIMGRKLSSLDSPYRIVPLDQLDTSKELISFAVEEQDVCEYQIDIISGEVYYKSDSAFEKAPMSLDEFLIYISVVQGTGVMKEQAFLSKNDNFRPFFGHISVGDQNVYVNPKRKIIAFEHGEKILVMAHSSQALQKLEEQCGLELEYI